MSRANTAGNTGMNNPSQAGVAGVDVAGVGAVPVLSTRPDPIIPKTAVHLGSVVKGIPVLRTRETPVQTPIIGVSVAPTASDGNKEIPIGNTGGFPLPLAKQSVEAYSAPYLVTMQGQPIKTGSNSQTIRLLDAFVHEYIMPGRAVLIQAVSQDKNFPAAAAAPELWDIGFDDYPFSIHLDTTQNNSGQVATTRYFGRVFLTGMSWNKIRVRSFTGVGALLKISTFENPIMMAFDSVVPTGGLLVMLALTVGLQLLGMA